MKRSCICLIIACAVGSVGSLGAGLAPESAAAPADMEIVDRVLEESGARRTPGAVDWSDWVGALAERMFRTLAGGIAAGLDRLPLSQGLLRALAVTLIATVVVIVLLVLSRFVRNRIRDARQERRPTRTIAMPRTDDAVRDPSWWRAELERWIDAGRIPEALAASWWWIAGTIAGPRADPTWTSRELMLQSGRTDLAEPLRRLDAMTYGSAAPQPATLRRFVAELEKGLL